LAVFAVAAAPEAKAEILNLECHFANQQYLNSWQVYWIDSGKGTITFALANAQGPDPATISTYPVVITPNPSNGKSQATAPTPPSTG
jgi:hypothetical protein